MTDRTACAMAVMAKAPVAGRCKTRLCPPLSPEQAAGLSAAFLRDITENLALASRSAAIAPYIAYAPAGMAALFSGLVAEGTGFVLADGAIEVPEGVTGFGACLLHAVQALLALGHPSACVVNSDSPTLPTSILIRAATALAAPGDRAVIAPAEDGGYTLLGVKQAHARLFADIDWSTDRVARQTRDRARAIGLDLVELETWFDVDDSASLARAAAGIADGRGYAAPATLVALSALGPGFALDRALSLRAHTSAA